MKKYTSLILSICLGATIGIAQADDNGALPGYVGSPSGTGSGHIIRTQFGECVQNQFFTAQDQNKDCANKTQQQVAVFSESTVILFDYDKFDINPKGKKILTDLIESAKQNGEISYSGITGYTDKIGKSSENKVLSTNRANAVGDYFVSLGIEPTYINAIGEGDKDTQVSDGCFLNNGEDPTDRIDTLNNDLKTASSKEKAKINKELTELNDNLAKLSACTAADRRGVITIETKNLAQQK